MSLIERLIKIIYANIYFRLNGNGKYKSESGQRTARNSPFDDDFEPAWEPDAGSQFDPELARYYANLEVPYGSDLETVRQAWKRLLKKYHPDLHSGEPEKQRIANELVQGLNRAYEELLKRLAK